MDSPDRPVRRLKASVAGTNLELMGDYNQRLVYQAIRTKGPITRNTLITLTGLAKPTIATIVKRLLNSGLVLETSRIYGGRGQPAVHLEINPEGCYAIGLHVLSGRLEMVAIDALGNAVGRASVAVSDPLFGARFSELIRQVGRERIIGIGLATSLQGGAEHVDLHTMSEVAPGIPIYVDSELAAAAAGESLFGLGATLQSYYYILMEARPVGGLVVQQALFKGSHPGRTRLLFAGVDLAWYRQAIAAGHAAPIDEAWMDAASRAFLPLLISINCLLNPGSVLLGGCVPQAWLTALAERCNALLLERAPEIPSHAGIRTTRLGPDATLIGAASLPMRARLYPVEEALLKAHDNAE